MSDIIAITVSVNYADYLDITLPQNAKFFSKWYIITSEDDDKTLDVIKKHNMPNIETLYFNFKSNNSVFNKGGAIAFAQSKLHSDCNVLVIDSDIYLPENFSEILYNICLKPNTIYSTGKRFDYYTYYNFLNNIVDFDYPWVDQFQGYFQLYKYDDDTKKIIYEQSYDCSDCDIVFKKQFKNRELIPSLHIKHLGLRGVNWCGRKSDIFK